MKNRNFPPPGKHFLVIPPIYWQCATDIRGAMLRQNSRGQVSIISESHPEMKAPALVALGGNFSLSDAASEVTGFYAIIERIRAYDYSHNRR